MNILLIFFALPIATIIISIALQKIFRCPILVAAIIFAIFIVLTFTIFGINFIVATIIYTIISFITAYITCLLQNSSVFINNQCSCNMARSGRNCNTCRNRNNCCNINNSIPTSDELLTINSTYCNDGNLLTISSNNNCTGEENDLLTINSNGNIINNTKLAPLTRNLVNP